MIREEGGLAVVRSLVDDRVVAMKILLDRLELRMKESLRAETEAEKARSGEWGSGGEEVNDRGEAIDFSGQIGEGKKTRRVITLTRLVFLSSFVPFIFATLLYFHTFSFEEFS